MVQNPKEQQGPSRIMLLQLKLAIVLLYVAFVALIAFGQMFANNVVTLAGLMCFTAAAALTTYYMVLTQP
jgi:uncharacterized membrane protein (DUF485 family)